MTEGESANLSRHDGFIPESLWTTLLTFSAAAIIPAAFVGGVTTKLALNYVTSNQLVRIAHAVNIAAIAVMSLGAGLTGSYEAFTIGRFIVGYPLGVCYVIVPALIAEMSEKSSQGLWQTMFGTVMSLALFMGSVLAHPLILGSKSLWPVLFSLGALPSVFALLASTKIPESPYRILKSGNKLQAINILKKLRKGKEEDIVGELQDIENEMNLSEKTLDIREILSVRQYRYQFIGVNVLFANLMLVGVNSIVLYSTLVFTNAGFSDENAAFATMGIFGLQFIFACFGSKLVHKFGGSRVCIGSNIILTFALLIFVLANSLAPLAPDVFPTVSIISVAIYMITFSGGTNLATFAVVGAITTAPTRVTCISYANITLWICSFLVSFLTPYLQRGLGYFAMTPWLVFAVAFLIYMLICLPNIRGKTSEEIPNKFRSKSATNCVRKSKPLMETKIEC